VFCSRFRYLKPKFYSRNFSIHSYGIVKAQITQWSDSPSTVLYRFYNTHGPNWTTSATNHKIIEERMLLYYKYQGIFRKNLTCIKLSPSFEMWHHIDWWNSLASAVFNAAWLQKNCVTFSHGLRKSEIHNNIQDEKGAHCVTS
jgi:hypothetical protein